MVMPFLWLIVLGFAQLSPFVLAHFDALSADTGLPWLAHFGYALVLVLATPASSLGMGPVGNLASIREHWLTSLDGLSVPFCGWKGSVVAELLRYVHSMAYAFNGYLDAISCCLASAAAFNYDWIMLYMYVLSIAVMYICVRCFAPGKQHTGDVRWMVLCGLLPGALDNKTECSLCLIRFITENMPQGVLQYMLMRHWQRTSGVTSPPLIIAIHLNIIMGITHLLKCLRSLRCVKDGYAFEEVDGDRTLQEDIDRSAANWRAPRHEDFALRPGDAGRQTRPRDYR